MKRYMQYVIALLGILLALTGQSCAPQEPDTVTVKEERVTQGPPIEEILPVNNCAGSVILQQDLLASKQYVHDVTVFPQRGKKINVGNIQAAVRDHYQVERLTESGICSVSANVPAGNFYVYQIEWTETFREGTVEVGQEDDDPEARYKFLESVACQLVGVETKRCP
ncbi:MAG TPA: hypothetical protein EYP49_13985 [Anaerolineae bacterium]|nr:hypothetical protein [Anaerolineae bacterium]